MYNRNKMTIINNRKQEREVSMKKGIKRFFIITATTITAIYAYNQYIAKKSIKNNYLSDKNSSYFEWKFGNIFYTKKGTGKPILLIHDTNPASSSAEWYQIQKKLEKTHTVYALDLPGCGRSDKPALTYTNYMYVQLITSFIKNVIGEATDVVTTNLSASFVIMANHIDSSLFQKIILVNPCSLSELSEIPDDKSKLIQKLFALPLIGTFLYNLTMNHKKINRDFHKQYYSRPQLISSKLEAIYYESAHLGKSQGRYLYASIKGNYININISHALKEQKQPLYILQSRSIKNAAQIVEEYTQLNPNTESIILSNCNLLPQLETPDKLYSCINSILNKTK